MNSQPQLADLLLPFRIPEKILAVLADGNVGVHSAAVHAHYRLGQKTRRHAHFFATWRQISL